MSAGRCRLEVPPKITRTELEQQPACKAWEVEERKGSRLPTDTSFSDIPTLTPTRPPRQKMTAYRMVGTFPLASTLHWSSRATLDRANKLAVIPC